MDMLGHSCVISPNGDVVALAQGLGDELVPYRCNLDMARSYKRFFDFKRNRRRRQAGGACWSWKVRGADC